MNNHNHPETPEPDYDFDTDDIDEFEPRDSWQRIVAGVLFAIIAVTTAAVLLSPWWMT